MQIWSSCRCSSAADALQFLFFRMVDAVGGFLFALLHFHNPSYPFHTYIIRSQVAVEQPRAFDEMMNMEQKIYFQLCLFAHDLFAYFRVRVPLLMRFSAPNPVLCIFPFAWIFFASLPTDFDSASSKQWTQEIALIISHNENCSFDSSQWRKRQFPMGIIVVWVFWRISYSTEFAVAVWSGAKERKRCSIFEYVDVFPIHSVEFYSDFGIRNHSRELPQYNWVQ